MNKFAIMSIRNLFFVISIFSAYAIYAQTSIIAYRSHSGNMKYFKISENSDNLGLPPISIDTIIKFSDTTCVEISSYGNGWGRMVDTVLNHPYCNNPNIDFDSMRQYYPKSVVFVGFDSTRVETVKTDSSTNDSPKTNEVVEPRRKKKKKQESLLIDYENNSPISPISPFSIFVISSLFLSLLTGYLIYKSSRKTHAV